MLSYSINELRWKYFIRILTMNFKNQTKFFLVFLIYMATTKAKSQTFTIVKTINYDTVYFVRPPILVQC
jgi:hypothetical protein